MPPVTITMNNRSSTPNRSNRFWMASRPPLEANTKEPRPSGAGVMCSRARSMGYAARQSCSSARPAQLILQARHR
jgi:hypothetical protein